MQTYNLATVAQQVEAIRAAIKSDGAFVAGCDELTVLCPDLVSETARLSGIAQIAAWENWHYEILPNDQVRFSPLPLRGTLENT